jgi:transcriptional regulator with XRE-family HTH domain
VADTFSTRLKAEMERQGVSGTELERRAGLSKGNGNRYAKGIRGKNVGADVALRIAVAMKLNVEWLTHGRGERYANASRVVADPQPSRVPLYETKLYKDAGPAVQEWFNTRRLAEDLTTEQWEEALRAAATLHALGLLVGGPTPRRKPAKQ